MKHYLDQSGAIRAIETDGSQDHLILPEWQELTEAQVAELTAPPAPTPEQVRDTKLRSLVHDYGDGRVIQCRDPAFAEDESRMRNAIELMERHGITERIWYMADNTPGTVTVDDLWAAIHSGQDQADAAWAEFFATIGDGA